MPHGPNVKKTSHKRFQFKGSTRENIAERKTVSLLRPGHVITKTKQRTQWLICFVNTERGGGGWGRGHGRAKRGELGSLQINFYRKRNAVNSRMASREIIARPLYFIGHYEEEKVTCTNDEKKVSQCQEPRHWVDSVASLMGYWNLLFSFRDKTAQDL